MTNIVHLYQLASNGRLKHLILSATQDKLITEWYTSKNNIDGKKQTTTDIISGMNIGRSNETTAEEQCLLEWERKVTKKKEEGYSEDINTCIEKTLDVTRILPDEFCASKPISDPPKDCFNGEYLAERKWNGECLLLHTTSDNEYIYSRRNHNLTENLLQLEIFQNILLRLPRNTLIMGEFIIVDEAGKEYPRLLKGLTNYATSPEKVLERFNLLISQGYRVDYKPFDTLFWNNLDVSNLPYINRYAIVQDNIGGRESFTFTKELEIEGRAQGYEGWILRNPNDTITYTMNGKPKRKGGYKYKYTWAEDVFVVGAELGSGKFKEAYAKFHIAQYQDGEVIRCGNTGYGHLTHEEVFELTTELQDKGYTDSVIDLNESDFFCLELEYLSRYDANKDGHLCFELGILDRIRNDKAPSECIYGERRIPGESLEDTNASQ